MFGRLAAVVASLCALCSALVAGTGPAPARSARSSRHQFAIQHHNPGVQSGVWQRPAWPSLRQARVRPPNHERGAVRHAGRFGDAFMVDTSVMVGPLSGSCNTFGAASNGNGWRVLWIDALEDSVSSAGISSDGTLLDPQGVPAGNYSIDPSWVQLASCIVGTGKGFVAVWPAGDRGIKGAALDSAGAVLDSFMVYESVYGQAMPSLAFDGDSTCLVAWTEISGGDIYARRVSIGGRPLDSFPIVVADDPEMYDEAPSVAFGLGVYLVTWTAYCDTSSVAQAVRVSKEGEVLDTAIFLRHAPAMIQAYPTVAFGDTCFLTAWSEGTNQSDIYAARVSAAGKIIDTVATQLRRAAEWGAFPSIGFDGNRYLVMWCESDTVTDETSICGRRLTADGLPTDSSMIAVRAPGLSCMLPSVAVDRANFLVAFTAADRESFDECVGCVRIGPEGFVLDSGIFMPLGADDQYGPSAATDSTDFLAVWLEDAAISAARITGDGGVLDPVGFTVSDEPDYNSGISVGYGDSVYLVAWANDRGINGYNVHCARVSSDGRVLDSEAIVVCDDSLDQYYPEVSFDGQNFLVVWQGPRLQTGRGSIYAARVSLEGTVLDPGGFAVAAADTFADQRPAVAFTGTDHLVVWEGTDLPNQSMHNIYGALVSPDGSITRPRFRIGPRRNQIQTEPSVARGTASSLVAWLDVNDGAIYATRVRGDGTVLDTSGVLVDSINYCNELPQVTADEAGFRVLWNTYGADSTRFSVARIDTTGELVRSGHWFGMPGNNGGFDAVCGSGPDLLLLFSHMTDTALGRYYGTNRVWGRLGNVPGIEESGRPQSIGARPMPTIVRGVLFLAEASSHQLQAAGLLDVTGREVMELRAGANDVSRLAPGVYFLREAQARPVRKIILTE